MPHRPGHTLADELRERRRLLEGGASNRVAAAPPRIVEDFVPDPRLAARPQAPAPVLNFERRPLESADQAVAETNRLRFALGPVAEPNVPQPPPAAGTIAERLVRQSSPQVASTSSPQVQQQAVDPGPTFIGRGVLQGDQGQQISLGPAERQALIDNPRLRELVGATLVGEPGFEATGPGQDPVQARIDRIGANFQEAGLGQDLFPGGAAAAQARLDDVADRVGQRLPPSSPRGRVFQEQRADEQAQLRREAAVRVAQARGQGGGAAEVARIRTESQERINERENELERERIASDESRFAVQQSNEVMDNIIDARIETAKLLEGEEQRAFTEETRKIAVEDAAFRQALLDLQGSKAQRRDAVKAMGKHFGIKRPNEDNVKDAILRRREEIKIAQQVRTGKL